MSFRGVFLSTSILLIIFGDVVSGSTNISASEPFWKMRPELYRTIQKEREILVSVKKLPTHPQWSFVGGGHVRADFQTSWEVARQFEQLGQLNWFFKKVTFDRSKRELVLDIKFLGFTRNLVVHIDEVQEGDAKGVLLFKIEQGFFQGLRGKMDISTYSPEVTEMGVEASYPGEVNLASFLFIPGSEAVMRYVAQEMRRIIEEKKSLQHP